MNKNLSYRSLEELKDYLKLLYQTQGLNAVKTWVIDNVTRGAGLTFKKGPSGTADETVEVHDRRMELLDKNGINIINADFLPPISNPIDFSVCIPYFSQRVLFIEEPFGLVVYKKT